MDDAQVDGGNVDDDYYSYPNDPIIEMNYTENYSQQDLENVEEWSWFFVFFSFLLFLVIILSKGCLHNPNYPNIHRYISEPALVLMVGMITGFFVSHFFQTTTTSNNNNNNNMASSSSSFHGDDTTADEPYIEVLANYVLSFSPNIFFMALLPPIIFYSGYSTQSELFYNNLRPIVLYACVGTTISTFGTAFILYGLVQTDLIRYNNASSTTITQSPSLLELLTFGSLISATDTVSVLSVLQSKNVDPTLFCLVFGESSLNDAVALVWFNTFSDFIIKQQEQQQQQQQTNPTNDNNDDSSYSGSTTNFHATDFAFVTDLLVDALVSPILGVLISIVLALLLKHWDFREQPMLELPLFVMLLYMPFVIAESFHVSGIVTTFFAGISARRYIVPNVSIGTVANANAIFQTSSFLAETCIFLELGLSVFGLHRDSFNWVLIGWSFVAILLSRALAIYPITMAYNYYYVSQRRHRQQQQLQQMQLQPQWKNDHNKDSENDKQHSNYDTNRNRPSYSSSNEDDGDVVCTDGLIRVSTTMNDSKNSSTNTNTNDGSLRTIGVAPIPKNDDDCRSSTVAFPTTSSMRQNLIWTSPTPTTTTTTVIAHPAMQQQQQHHLHNTQVHDCSKPINHNNHCTRTKQTTTTTTRIPPRTTNNNKTIPSSYVHFLWFAGLRGAVAYACARKFPNTNGHANEYIATTMVTVLISIIGMGGCTESIIQLLHLEPTTTTATTTTTTIELSQTTTLPTTITNRNDITVHNTNKNNNNNTEDDDDTVYTTMNDEKNDNHTDFSLYYECNATNEDILVPVGCNYHGGRLRRFEKRYIFQVVVRQPEEESEERNETQP